MTIDENDEQANAKAKPIVLHQEEIEAITEALRSKQIKIASEIARAENEMTALGGGDPAACLTTYAEAELNRIAHIAITHRINKIRSIVPSSNHPELACLAADVLALRFPKLQAGAANSLI